MADARGRDALARALMEAPPYNPLAGFDQRRAPSSGVSTPGRMYEVNINASPESFLDWDKPLSQQSEKARSALSRVPEGVATNGQAETILSAARRNDYRVLPEEGVDRLIKNLGPDGTSLLREAGIPGIRYLDQGSRGAGEGSRNYVAFDDSLIEILRKYGLLPPAVAGGVAAYPENQQ